MVNLVLYINGTHKEDDVSTPKSMMLCMIKVDLCINCLMVSGACTTLYDFVKSQLSRFVKESL